MRIKVALVIIYNHRYDKNIDVINKIYRERFSDIYHLMPFYDGDELNVIPVYENSHYFQGYIAQGFKEFYREEYSHYIFIADDLILNPIINEENYTKYLKLESETSFITELISLHERKEFWRRIREAYEYTTNKAGIEIQDELPSYDNAIEKFNNFSLTIKPLNVNSMHQEVTPSILEGGPYEITYPLVGGYSDLAVVSADCIKRFCHYCGVFSASDLFVELAIPTALILSSKKIVTNDELRLKGKALWSNEDLKMLIKYNNNLNTLLTNFPKNYLYLHPIKLSGWKTLT